MSDANVEMQVGTAGGWGPAVRRVVRRPAFVAVAVVLIVAALGLNVVTEALQLHFKKLPVPLAKRLDTLPARLGDWELVPNDAVMSHDMVEALGTEEYAFLDYVNTRAVSGSELASLRAATGRDRQMKLAQVQQARPTAVVNLGLTYYTGKADTVAHIPDVCYIAGGFEPRTYEQTVWPIAGRMPGATGADVKVRYIHFEDQTPARVRQRRNVAYVFHVNGHFEDDSLGVRRSLQNLFERHGYYMKIEVMTTDPDKDRGGRVITDFLTAALPEIGQCLPDWQAVRASR